MPNYSSYQGVGYCLDVSSLPSQSDILREFIEKSEAEMQKVRYCSIEWRIMYFLGVVFTGLLSFHVVTAKRLTDSYSADNCEELYEYKETDCNEPLTNVTSDSCHEACVDLGQAVNNALWISLFTLIYSVSFAFFMARACKKANEQNSTPVNDFSNLSNITDQVNRSLNMDLSNYSLQDALKLAKTKKKELEGSRSCCCRFFSSSTSINYGPSQPLMPRSLSLNN